MILSTTPQIEGHTIREYKGIVTGETIIGANMFKDLFAGIRDIVGGRAGAYEKVLSEAKDTSMQEMMQRAQALGANAIVGIDIDYEKTRSFCRVKERGCHRVARPLQVAARLIFFHGLRRFPDERGYSNLRGRASALLLHIIWFRYCIIQKKYVSLHPMTTTLLIGLLIPLLGTMLGSAFVFFMRDEMSARLQKSLLGFASGVMVAASVWSLLIPAMEMASMDNGQLIMDNEASAWSVVPAAVGFLLGMGFLLLIDELTPHLHIGTDKPEGMRSHLSKTAMLALAVTIHNLPEGMAVGVVFAGADSGATNISLASAIAVSLGIAIQNVPEGAIISMPMRAAGNSRWRSFLLGSLSGAVEPIGAIAVLLLASLLMPVLPYMLAFAAGAMFYVVVEELIPEASSGQHSNLSTIGFAIGFVLMMVLDVVMG